MNRRGTPRRRRRTGRLTDVHDQIEHGLPLKAFYDLVHETGMAESRLREIARISSSTFSRRKQSGRFSPEESDRLARIGRVVSRVRRFFDGSARDALDWLTEPAFAFNGRQPIELLSTDAGATEVEHLIGRIEHGVFT